MARDPPMASSPTPSSQSASLNCFKYSKKSKKKPEIKVESGQEVSILFEDTLAWDDDPCILYVDDDDDVVVSPDPLFCPITPRPVADSHRLSCWDADNRSLTWDHAGDLQKSFGPKKELQWSREDFYIELEKPLGQRSKTNKKSLLTRLKQIFKLKHSLKK